MVKYDYSILKDPRDKRLAKEHELIEELCSRSNKISYKIIKQFGGLPPEGYEITYDGVKSIIGINQDNTPVYGEYHVAEIVFPPEYPSSDGPPKCTMKTDAWHPNIRAKNPRKGRICINSKLLGAWHTLDFLILRIGHMLQYKNYHAIDQDPWPEDPDVAKWVREYAEPKNIVNLLNNISVDNTELLKPISSEQSTNIDQMYFQKRISDDISEEIEIDDIMADEITISLKNKEEELEDDLNMTFSTQKKQNLFDNFYEDIRFTKK